MKENISWEDFSKIDLRIGTILAAEEFPKARKPAYKLQIDFGQLGIKKSSAQITDCYTPEDLIGKQVMAVCNFPPKQIADFMSECLVMGVIGDTRGVILLHPGLTVENGAQIA